MAQKDSLNCPFEHIKNPDLEIKKINEISQRTVSLLDNRYPVPDKILRGVHPKSHGCVSASFEINADIDQSLQVGLFKSPGKVFDASIRFSNASVRVEPDISDAGEHGSRGMAIKIYDVGGEVLIEDNGGRNQDFLMINQPVFAFANTDDYLILMRILDRNNDNSDSFFDPLKLQDPTLSEEDRQQILEYIKAENIDEQGIKRILDTLTIVKQIKSTSVANPLNIQYFSAAPFLFGSDRVMKFSVKPVYQVTPTVLPPDLAPDYLRRALKESVFQNERVEFDFMVQVRSDDGDKMGIENASSIWDEKQFPFIKIAKITIPTPQTEVDSDVNEARCEAMAFTPWHSLSEHQPIGSINRLRKDVYQTSAKHRKAEREVESELFLVRWFKSFLESL
ncbi:MAG: catalase family protein [Methylococcales bacterium]|nr:catalase family protein [Methylococcales bacterium]